MSGGGREQDKPCSWGRWRLSGSVGIKPARRGKLTGPQSARLGSSVLTEDRGTLSSNHTPHSLGKQIYCVSAGSSGGLASPSAPRTVGDPRPAKLVDDMHSREHPLAQQTGPSPRPVWTPCQVLGRQRKPKCDPCTTCRGQTGGNRESCWATVPPVAESSHLRIAFCWELGVACGHCLPGVDHSVGRVPPLGVHGDKKGFVEKGRASAL